MYLCWLRYYCVFYELKIHIRVILPTFWERRQLYPRPNLIPPVTLRFLLWTQSNNPRLYVPPKLTLLKSTKKQVDSYGTKRKVRTFYKTTDILRPNHQIKKSQESFTQWRKIGDTKDYSLGNIKFNKKGSLFHIKERVTKVLNRNRNKRFQTRNTQNDTKETQYDNSK